MKIKHVHTKRAKGRTYHYFATGQTTPAGKPILKRLPDPSDPTFGRALADCQRARTLRAKVETELTVAKLIGLYERSDRYRTKLAEASRRNYAIYLEVIRDQIGPAPADAIERKHAMLLLDKLAAKPAAANMTVRTLGALYQWGRERGHVTGNPTQGIAYLKEGEHAPWPEHVLNAALVSEDPFIRRATALLYYTAQRAGDVLAMRWGDIRGDRIEVRQQKTGKALSIRLHADLARELAAAPRTGLTILARSDARPYSVEALRRSLQAFAAERGARVVTHGLRKNAVIALLEAGCSTAETAAISGQTLQMVEYYARQRSTTRLGDSAILKWEQKK